VPPGTFDALFAMLAASGTSSVVAAGRDNVHQVCVCVFCACA